ncbi:unnamed protein product [Ambrosiozyma monospora]|uniref:Unnamed protein product n=1 Tax=Ambrosiozyma monospora TaxID=43982 RepID=A0ACB5T1I0_AMBMO|nr:unnamed protein product [Ambrosiozyma monospora]
MMKPSLNKLKTITSTIHSMNLLMSPSSETQHIPINQHKSTKMSGTYSHISDLTPEELKSIEDTVKACENFHFSDFQLTPINIKTQVVNTFNNKASKTQHLQMTPQLETLTLC